MCCGAAHGTLTLPEEDVKMLIFFAHWVCESGKSLRKDMTTDASLQPSADAS